MTKANVLESVLSLWRYPVKSMLSEEIQQAKVIARGLIGDRIFAVQDQATGKIASAKHPRKWGGLLQYRASYFAVDDGVPAVRLEQPGRDE